MVQNIKESKRDFYEYSCSSLYNIGKQNLTSSILRHLRGTYFVFELEVVVGLDWWTIRYGCILTPLPSTVPGRRIRSSAGPTTNKGAPGWMPPRASGDEIILGAPDALDAPAEHRTRAASAFSNESARTRRTCESEWLLRCAWRGRGGTALRVDEREAGTDEGSEVDGKHEEVGDETNP